MRKRLANYRVANPERLPRRTVLTPAMSGKCGLRFSRQPVSTMPPPHPAATDRDTHARWGVFRECSSPEKVQIGFVVLVFITGL